MKKLIVSLLIFSSLVHASEMSQKPRIVRFVSDLSDPNGLSEERKKVIASLIRAEFYKHPSFENIQAVQNLVDTIRVEIARRYTLLEAQLSTLGYDDWIEQCRDTHLFPSC